MFKLFYSVRVLSWLCTCGSRTSCDGEGFFRGSAYVVASFFRSICDWFFFFQAGGGIRDVAVTGVQTCALPI